MDGMRCGEWVRLALGTHAVLQKAKLIVTLLETGPIRTNLGVTSADLDLWIHQLKKVSL